MEISKKYLNNYVKEEMEAAFDREDIIVSYTSDYRTTKFSQVHNSVELLFVEEGGANYRIEGETYAVEKNTILIVGATDRHISHITKPPYVRYGLNLMPSYLHSLPIISGSMNIYQTHDPEHAARLRGIEDRIFQRILQIVCELHEETEDGTGNKERGKNEMVYALLLELTIFLKRLLDIDNPAYNEKYRSMEEIRSYIDIHYSEDLSLNELSKRFYLQPNTISKNFSAVCGKTLNQYINSVRIANAAHILETEPVSITELATMVGYSSINTFLRQFREKMDVSPLQYRKQVSQLMKDKERRHLF